MWICRGKRRSRTRLKLERLGKKPRDILPSRLDLVSFLYRSANYRLLINNPKIQEVDIDELCNELSDKARCDPRPPVFVEHSFKDIVKRLSSMSKR